MRKILTVAVAAMVSFAAGSAFADEHEYDDLTWVPLEAWACNFNEGMGPEDLAEVTKEWNDWMDDEGQTDYFAFTMWPAYFGELNFDVAWMGVWSDGNAMGAGTDHWMSEGGELNAKFTEVVDCVSHTQFASGRLRQPSEDQSDGDDNFVLAFSNCKFKEDGGGMEAYRAAHEEWNAYADEHGFVGGSWMLFPVWGENVEADYHFKWVSSATNFTSLGANWQRYADGHYRKESELFDPIVDCDSARIYAAKVEREMAEDE